jgi:Holliday junction resolvasome RuvABC endonuclease subunit
MTILALDASINNTGMVIFDEKNNNNIEFVQVLVPKQLKKAKGVSASSRDQYRIEQIINEIISVCETYKVDVIVAEQVISGCKNASALKTLSLVAGMLYAVDVLYRPITFINVREVKLALTNDKDASKDSVIGAVLERYPILTDRLSSNRAVSGYNGKAEHIADAVSVYEAFVKQQQRKEV